MVRVGIPASFPRFSAECKSMGAAVMVSANAFRSKGRWRMPRPDEFNGCDMALDSAGFVAMVRYKGYPWSVAEYVTLARSYPWTWYATMDFCCEPEIAKDRAEVLRRVDLTAKYLAVVRNEAREQGAPMPMPVLQGWRPDDYRRCADALGVENGLVGIGSVCRRQVAGPSGVISIMDALDRHLPKDVTLHLFGVKSDALSALLHWPRIASVDSMAWDFAARRDANKRGISCSIEHRKRHMRRWYAGQRAALARRPPIQLEFAA